MNDVDHASPDDPGENTAGSIREKYPSGWLALTKNESVAHMIDALLDLPQLREFNQSELADMADVSRQSVVRHIDLLVDLEIINPIEGPGRTRYRFNPESRVSQALIELDGAVSATGQRHDE
jgi:hypothetical protein